MLDKHASLLNAGQTQNGDPPAPPKKKAQRKKVKVEVDETKNDVNTRGQSKKGVGGNHHHHHLLRNERDNDDIDEVLPLVTL